MALALLNAVYPHKFTPRPSSSMLQKVVTLLRGQRSTFPRCICVGAVGVREGWIHLLASSDTVRRSYVNSGRKSSCTSITTAFEGWHIAHDLPLATSHSGSLLQTYVGTLWSGREQLICREESCVVTWNDLKRSMLLANDFFLYQNCRRDHDFPLTVMTM